ncbi:HAD-IA family hydrolase [Bacillus xiapuensis]|uniref:HAD-IA family hydrolase n=1 Tax=Bacillus xiapuensis TaxID=2014075 RepID=UPI000C230DAC|nr:HAD-IA family hydrolase [Bacillus xiapuensis]
MAKYIVFDFDGTLANSLKVFLAAYNQLAEKEGYRTVQESEIDRLSKMTIPERCRYLNFPIRNIPFAAPKLYRFVRESQNDLKFFPGIKELLDELKNHGYRLAIISSNAKDIIGRSLEAHQVNYFDDILCSKYIFSKDKMLKKLLNKYKLKPSDALYIGDEERDISACNKVGVKVIWAGWGYDDEEVALNANPDYIANEPADVLPILLKWNIS